MDSMNNASRERRLNSTVAHTTEGLLGFLFRALKGPAKFTKPLRAHFKLTPMGFNPDASLVSLFSPCVGAEAPTHMFFLADG